ncbi:MAG: phosphate ABC transporter ATP-binding protein [Dehalococcoidales bacterium]|jgi:phosphate transport system ATP-binding protein
MIVNTQNTNSRFQDAVTRERKLPGGIETRDLEICYSDSKVIMGLNINFTPGKITAIIGPSGCGKTTLLRSLNRLSELTGGCKVKGQILLDGEDILKMDPMLLRQRIGMVFQKPNPFPKSIRENILYGPKALKLKIDHDAIVRSCLEKAALWNELKDRLHDSAFKLSIGQQQRLCIARTLAINPEVILLDEPASALDPLSTASLETSILAMRGEYTQIIVTHNMNEARKVSDYVAFLYMGTLVEYGETEKVFTNPERPETRDYINGKFY